MSDFELSIINTIESFYPEANHFGCQFHYTQCLQKHLKENQLTTKKIKENKELKNWFRLFTTLSLVPKERFHEAVKLILLMKPIVVEEAVVSIKLF